MLRDSNNGAIGNWFCPACHVENDYFQNRCTSCNKGEKDERCTIQSPKPLRTSSNMKNSWASQAKGGAAHSNSNGSNANSPLPSSNSKPNLAASAASPRGGLSRSGGKNDKNDKNDIPSQPQKTPSNKNVALRFEETVEIKRTLGDLSKAVSKNKLDPSKNVVGHYCKWDWLYCSGDCDNSDLYYSNVNLFHDLVDEEPVRAVVVLATVVYDDTWLEQVTVGLRSMGLLSEPMEKTDEHGSTAPTKSEKREKKKEYSQSKIDALRNRMEQNSSISKNLQAMTPTKKKTNSKAQKVKISIYGGNDYDDYDDEEDSFDDETPESGDEYYEGYDDSQGSGSEDWVKKQSRLTEEEQIARILQQEILEQQRLNPPPQEQAKKTNDVPTTPHAKPKSEPVPLTFAQMQQQKAKPQLNQKQQQQQQKQPYVPPPKVTPVPTPQPKPQSNANQQQQQHTQNGQKKQNNNNPAQQNNKNGKDQSRPGVQKNQNQNTKQPQKLKI